jgi:hypothetical protein
MTYLITNLQFYIQAWSALHNCNLWP